MFNLPFPTDSLYKFSFMFGLALIVFSVYYNDSFLNKFNSKTVIYKVDSLKKKNIIQDNILLLQIANREHIRDDLANRGDKTFSANTKKIIKKLRYPSFFFKDPQDLKFYKDSLKSIINDDSASDEKIEHFLEVVINYHIKKYKETNDQFVFFNGKLLYQKYAFYGMLVTGILLFLPGLMLWYYKIQKPQDELLNIQLEEARKKTPISGRKHFEPKILPRPEVRNKV